MASRRKQHRTAATRIREYKLRLPEDIAERIEAKAKVERCAQNRVIINELALYPNLEKQAAAVDLDGLFAKYGARITWLDLSEALLEAVDRILKTAGTAQQAAIDKLRVERNAMLKTKS